MLVLRSSVVFLALAAKTQNAMSVVATAHAAMDVAIACQASVIQR